MRSCWDLDWLFKASQITKRSDVISIKFLKNDILCWESDSGLHSGGSNLNILLLTVPGWRNCVVCVCVSFARQQQHSKIPPHLVAAVGLDRLEQLKTP